MTEIESNLSKLKVYKNFGIIQIDNGKKNFITEPEFVNLNILKDWINQNHLLGIIICGNKSNFSYGADILTVQKTDECDDALVIKLRKGRDLLDYIEEIPIVTIAAINGACFGAGLEIALSCQFRIASRGCFLALPEINRGVIPGMGGCERCAKLIGREKTIEFCLLGELISVEKACEIGMITRITSEKPLDEAISFMEEILDDTNELQVRSIIKNINEFSKTSGSDKDMAFVNCLRKSELSLEKNKDERI